jgi:transcriptional regulator with XRE-family HTH domain
VPPRNPGRAQLAEEALAARIAYEREKRGMSYEGLARRLTDVGCPTNQSAIFKIEKGQPRRRITVEELVALGQVFDLPVEDLLVPLEFVELRVAWDLLAEVMDAEAARIEAHNRSTAGREALQAYMREHPDVGLEELVRNYAADREEPELFTAYWMNVATGGEAEWGERLRAALERPGDSRG